MSILCNCPDSELLAHTAAEYVCDFIVRAQACVGAKLPPKEGGWHCNMYSHDTVRSAAPHRTPPQLLRTRSAHQGCTSSSLCARPHYMLQPDPGLRRRAAKRCAQHQYAGSCQRNMAPHRSCQKPGIMLQDKAVQNLVQGHQLIMKASSRSPSAYRASSVARMPPLFATQYFSGSAAAASTMLGEELDTMNTLPTSAARSAQTQSRHVNASVPTMPTQSAVQARRGEAWRGFEEHRCAIRDMRVDP